MEGVKSALQSKTVWAALITILTSALGLLGVTLTPEDQTYLVGAAVSGVTLITGLAGLYGRLKANTRIGGVVTPDSAKAPVLTAKPESVAPSIIRP